MEAVLCKREYLPHFYLPFIFQKMASIPTDPLLIIIIIIILHLCREFREVCGFEKVTYDSQFTLLKQDFLPYFEIMFHSLVNYTDFICQTIN